MRSHNRLFSILLWCNGLSNLGNFATYALLAVYFLTVLHLPTEMVSVILFFAAISLRISRIIFAPVINLLGTQLALPLSMMFCTTGYLLLAFIHTVPIIFISLLIIGIGYGTNSLIIRSMTSVLNNGTTLMRYAALNMITNIATAFGPFIGNILMLSYPQHGLFLFSASIYILATIVTLVYPLHSDTNIQSSQWFADIATQLRYGKVWFSIVLAILIWFLLAQFFSLLPIYISKGLSAPHLLGSIYLLNSLVVIVLSLPLCRWIERNNLAISWQILGFFGLFMLGFAVLATWQSIVGVYVVIVILSIAEVVITPALNTLIVNVTQQHARLSGFAINAIAMGIGEGCGNFVGVLIAGFAYASNQWQIPFIGFAMITLIFMCFILINFKREEFILVNGGKI